MGEQRQGAELFTVEQAQELCDSVHGSGLDSDPRITDLGRNVRVCWEYHLMNDDGFYCGWWHFTMVIPKANPLGFRLVGHRGNPRGAPADGIREYLDEMFHMALEKRQES
jgi:hypothetical protein